MELYIVDAFTTELFQGNQAGVALFDGHEDIPDYEYMKDLAAELKHSETVYVKKNGGNRFSPRYFTPTGEVDLCGHATISAFTVLREQNYFTAGTYIADTRTGNLDITVREDSVWMDMAEPEELLVFRQNGCEALYDSYGLDISAMPDGLLPQVICTGLRDILLPVKNKAYLNEAVMDPEKVRMISKEYQVAGIHMFCISEEKDITAYCRNFAPLLGIQEEAATGTSNGALTYYLRQHGVIRDHAVNTFLQGEAKGKPSRIYSVIHQNNIRIGGSARISLVLSMYRN